MPGEDYTTLRLSRELTPSEIEDVVAGRVTSESKLTLPVVEGLYGKVKPAYSMGDGDIDMDADVFRISRITRAPPVRRLRNDSSDNLNRLFSGKTVDGTSHLLFF